VSWFLVKRHTALEQTARPVRPGARIARIPQAPNVSAPSYALAAVPNTSVLSRPGPQAVSRAAGAVCAVLVSGVLGLAVYGAWHLRVQAVEAATASAEDHALALAAHASQVFSAAQYVVDSLATAARREGQADMMTLRQRFGSRVEHELLRARAQNFQALDSVAILDADGRLVNWSLSYPPPGTSLGDRESFVAARDGPAGVSHVSGPVRSRLRPSWVFTVSRRLESADGRFVGVAVVGLSPAYFSNFYASLRMDRRDPQEDATAMTLLRDDLTVLARAPFDEAGLGQRLRSDGPYGRFLGDTGSAAPPSGSFSPWDAQPEVGRQLLLVGHAVEGVPLHVVVALRDSVYLQSWRNQAIGIGGFAVAASAFLTGVFEVLVRMLRRREQHLAEAERLREAAEAANRAKSEFLATVSHEIRTPMNGILGTADLLVRAPLDERERALAETLLRSARNLLGIINDILDLSKIEANELQVLKAPFCPRTLMKEVHDLFVNYARGKGLALTVEVADEVPPAVMGDVNRMRQVLGNLVSNAIKFSESGQVRMRLAAQAGEQELWHLRFEVEDSGVGIPPDAHDRVFQPFAQVDSSAARRFGGTGLGLTISQRLVQLMGGRIDFESAPGQGTRFWCEVPMPLAHELPAPPAPDDVPEFRFAHSGAMPLPAARPLEQAAGSTRPRHVLVVEDNPVNALVVEAQLVSLGCTCRVAVDGEEALQCLREGGHDLVLMDCMLPTISGYQVTQRWRQEEAQRGAPRVPIIALTANALASSLDEALAAGMDDFLTKPCPVDRLATVLRRWLAPTANTPVAG
jgi:two-component system, sensor histidine kinase